MKLDGACSQTQNIIWRNPKWWSSACVYTVLLRYYIIHCYVCRRGRSRSDGANDFLHGFQCFPRTRFRFEWLLRRSCEIYRRRRIRTDRRGFPAKSVRLVIVSQLKVFGSYNNDRRYPSITVADSTCYIRPYRGSARDANDSHCLVEHLIHPNEFFLHGRFLTNSNVYCNKMKVWLFVLGRVLPSNLHGTGDALVFRRFSAFGRTEVVRVEIVFWYTVRKLSRFYPRSSRNSLRGKP